jgi:hypothetical protein
MSATRKIELKEVESFIRRKLCKKLQRDLRELRIVKEGDLECCTYYHLRRFLSDDPRWKVLARRHWRVSGKHRYTDLIIFLNHTPCIAIELKWRRKKISRKDLKSLKSALKELKVHKAYFITTVIPDASEYKRSQKEICEIPVGLDFSEDNYERWREEKRKFTKALKM